ncbi:MAG: FAD:protein FMN transferase [Phycisphaerae bacterium]|nr:FAD:protein FMN transferase [Phycisphaerae bacterium]
MEQKLRSIMVLVGMVGIIALVAAGIWMQHSDNPPMLMRTSHRSKIMSTPQFNITVVVSPAQAVWMEDMFDNAEAAARTVETTMNIHKPGTPLYEFNHAPAGVLVPLPPETVKVLTDSAIVWEQSDKAFDVTACPLFRLWKNACETKRMPTKAQLLAARNESCWDNIEIHDTGAIKTLDTAGVDMGGIAKGYAIDRAAESLIAAGAIGGVVDIGGDVRCFGRKPSNTPWVVGICNPFVAADRRTGKPDDQFATLGIRDGAVCTSGNYERYCEIDGKKYSHIINPYTAMPTELYPSVTVVAPDAETADAWATAISVLGPDILPRLVGTKIEAMVIIGTAENYSWKMTPGFKKLLIRHPKLKNGKNGNR